MKAIRFFCRHGIADGDEDVERIRDKLRQNVDDQHFVSSAVNVIMAAEPGVIQWMGERYSYRVDWRLMRAIAGAMRDHGLSSTRSALANSIFSVALCDWNKVVTSDGTDDDRTKNLLFAVIDFAKDDSFPETECKNAIAAAYRICRTLPKEHSGYDEILPFLIGLMRTSNQDVSEHACKALRRLRLPQTGEWVAREFRQEFRLISPYTHKEEWPITDEHIAFMERLGSEINQAAIKSDVGCVRACSAMTTWATQCPDLILQSVSPGYDDPPIEYFVNALVRNGSPGVIERCCEILESKSSHTYDRHFATCVLRGIGWQPKSMFHEGLMLLSANRRIELDNNEYAVQIARVARLGDAGFKALEHVFSTMESLHVADYIRKFFRACLLLDLDELLRFEPYFLKMVEERALFRGGCPFPNWEAGQVLAKLATPRIVELCEEKLRKWESEERVNACAVLSNVDWAPSTGFLGALHALTVNPFFDAGFIKELQAEANERGYEYDVERGYLRDFKLILEVRLKLAIKFGKEGDRAVEFCLRNGDIGDEFFDAMIKLDTVQFVDVLDELIRVGKLSNRVSALDAVHYFKTGKVRPSRTGSGVTHMDGMIR